MTPLHFSKLLFSWIVLHIALLHAGIIISQQDGDYEQQVLNCTEGEACEVFCDHPSACRQTTIQCPSDHACNVTCSDNYACEESIIYAQNSASFHLLDCSSGRWTCVGITIYFPPNDNGEPKAHLIGGDRGLSAGQSISQPLQFYGIYGWNDVHIEVTNKHNFDNHRGVMHCTIDYSSSCNFSDTAWLCADANDLCNNPPTISPTISPTTDTANPTNNPTINPTINPTYKTTINPTNNPTYKSTINPTVTLTANPTLVPSQTPTSLPTTTPTNNPTHAQTDIPSLITTIRSSTADAITSNSTLYPIVSTTASTSNPETELSSTSLPAITTSLPITETTNTSISSTILPTIEANTSTSFIVSSSVSLAAIISDTKAESASVSTDTLLLHPLYIISIGLVVLLFCFVLLFVFWCRGAYQKRKIHTLSNAVVYKDKDPESSRRSVSSSRTISEEGYIQELETKPNIRIEIHALKQAAPLYLNGNPYTGAAGHTRAISAGSALSVISTLSAASGFSEDIKSPSELTPRNVHRTHFKQTSTADLSHLRPMSFPVQPMRHQSTLSGLSDISSVGYAAVDKQRILSNTDTWEEQMRELKQQWHNIQSLSPKHAQNKIYNDIPNTAPATMDHNVFFNQMLSNFNPQQHSGNMDAKENEAHVYSNNGKKSVDDERSDFGSDENSSSDSTNTNTGGDSSEYSDSNSTSLSTTATTATTATSMTSNTASNTHRSRKARKNHFRAPSVITEHLSESDDSADLPQLIEIDEGEEMVDDHDLNMIPELDEDEHEDEYDLSRASKKDSMDSSVTETQTTISHHKHPTMEIRIDRISENDDDHDGSYQENDGSYHEMFTLSTKDISKSFNTDEENNSEEHAYDHEYYDEYDQYED